MGDSELRIPVSLRLSRRPYAGLTGPRYKLKAKAFQLELRSSNSPTTLKGPSPALRAAARFIPYGVRAAAATAIQFPSIYIYILIDFRKYANCDR